MKEYKVERFGRRCADHLDADEKMVAGLNILAKDGWKVILDLNQEPHCYSLLLEREIPEPSTQNAELSAGERGVTRPTIRQLQI